MSANVALSDTFDQWRMKTNEWLSMTNSAGSSDFIKLTNTTNSTSNTTGSITTAGGMGIVASATIGDDLTIHGRADLKSTTNLDAVDIDGAVQIDGAVTVGVDDTGYDVKFFGATASAYMLWDESSNDLELTGAAAVSIDTTTDSSNTTTGSFHTDGGVGIAKKLYVGTHLDVDGTTNFDAVDIDDTTQIDNTVTVGTNGSGFDVKFFGATASSYLLWDASADDLILAGASAVSIDNTADATGTTDGSFHTDGGVGIAKKLYVGTDLDVNGTTNLDIVDIDDTTQIDNTVTVGVDNTGYDVKLFGASSGKYWLWDEDEDKVVAVSNLQQTGTITVGVDDTGHDVKFFGDTASAYMLWDEDEDDLILVGDAAISIDATTDSSNTTTGSFHTDGGVGIAKKLYVGTHLDVDGTSNLDIVDIDSTVQIDNTVSVSTNGNGQDVKFFGATSGSYWHWDASADKVIQVGSTQLTGGLTIGEDDTGHDVKFFGASSGAYMIYDQSEDTLEIRGAAADATTSSGKLLLSTSLNDINDGDILGSIGFKAPQEGSSGDSRLVGASIYAEADATFSASVNSTDLVFATGDSEAAQERLRIDSTGQVTFADGAIDIDIASHDGSNGLKLGGTLITRSAASLNASASLGKCAALAIVFA